MFIQKRCYQTTHKQSFINQKTKRMLKTIAGLQGVTILSKDAQKKIGGGRESWSCSCTGSVGSWTYDSNVNSQNIQAIASHDVALYCSTGQGTCTVTKNFLEVEP